MTDIRKVQRGAMSLVNSEKWDVVSARESNLVVICQLRLPHVAKYIRP